MANAKRAQPAWDASRFKPKSMLIRHATHGDATFTITKPAEFMFYEDNGRPRFAIEVETDDPPKGHVLDVLGSASMWLWGIHVSAADLAALSGSVIACNDWLERGGEVHEYVVFNLHDTIETRDTAVRFVSSGSGGSRIQIVTNADDVDAYDERAKPNPIYVDAVLAARPAKLVNRISD